MGEQLGPKTDAQNDLPPTSFIFDKFSQFRDPSFISMSIMPAPCDGKALHVITDGRFAAN
jgi:hypothetical protein